MEEESEITQQTETQNKSDGKISAKRIKMYKDMDSNSKKATSEWFNQIANGIYGKNSQIAKNVGQQLYNNYEKTEIIQKNLRSLIGNNIEIKIDQLKTLEDDFLYSPCLGKVVAIKPLFLDEELVIFDLEDLKEIEKYYRLHSEEESERYFRDAPFYNVDLVETENQVMKEMEIMNDIKKQCELQNFNKVLECVENYHRSQEIKQDQEYSRELNEYYKKKQE